MFAPTNKLLFLRNWFFDVQNSQLFYVASIRERASDRFKKVNFARYSITSYNYKSKCLCKCISEHCVRVLFLDIAKDILKPPLRKVNAVVSHQDPFIAKQH